MGKILSLAELKQERERLRLEGRTIVFTNGCFDLLHPGHVRYLQQARNLGDALIVALNSDRAVQELKGDSRPILKESERTEVVAALSCVDYVIVFDDISPLKTIATILPDILVKGGDWGTDQIIGAKEVTIAGGQVLSLSYIEGISTSEIIDRIVKSCRESTT
jgi:D-beta-D-heptose 7-phosphate kinase/D-beta-D-heptose 1-phosphate adenosyltransferase